MWRLAWRNLWRNRTRTAITGSAISLGLLLQLFSMGIADSSYEKMLDAARQAAGGSVLVHADGYWSSRASDRVVRQASEKRTTLLQVDGVADVAPRLAITGLLSTARGAVGAEVLGFVPEVEQGFEDRGRFVTEGTFFGTDEKSPIVLGAGIVDDLKMELGDRVIVTATDPAGDVTRLAFRLVGVVHSGSQAMDATTAWTTLDSLREQLGAEDVATQLGIRLEDGAARGSVAASVRTRLANDGLEVLTWEEAMPEMLAFVEIDKQWSHLMGICIFVIVAFGIANTFMMAVLERIRELGLLSALGASPGRIAGLVLSESVLLAALAIAVGLAGALALHAVVAAHGIDFAAMTGGADVEMSGVIMADMRIYSVIDWVRWGGACGLVAVLIVASALFPAWKATRMEPVTAMRTYE